MVVCVKLASFLVTPIHMKDTDGSLLATVINCGLSKRLTAI